MQGLALNTVSYTHLDVYKRQPLVIPPEFNLRPPRPGEARPLELRPDLQARTAVFGVQTGLGASDGEKMLIQKIGAENADPRIRDVVDEESGAITHKPEKFADRVIALAKKPGTPAHPLDSETEAADLKLSLIHIQLCIRDRGNSCQKRTFAPFFIAN